MPIANDFAISRELGISPEQLSVIKSCHRDPENPFWIQPLAVVVGGLSDEEHLHRTIDWFINANDIFQLRVQSNGDEQFKRVTVENEPAVVEYIDAEEIKPEELASEINWIILDEGEYGYDLAHDPLVRVKVLRIQEDRWLILFLLHRLVYHRGVKSRYLQTFIHALHNVTSSPVVTVPLRMPSFFDNMRQYHTDISARIANCLHMSSVAGCRQDASFLSGNRVDIQPPANEAGFVDQDLTAYIDVLHRLETTHDVSRMDFFLGAALLWHYIFCRISSPNLQVELPDDFLPPADNIIGPISRQMSISTKITADETIAELIRSVGRQLHETDSEPHFPHEFVVSGRNPSGEKHGRILCRFHGLDRINIHAEDFWVCWSDDDIISTEYDIELICKTSTDSLNLVMVYNQMLVGFEEATSWLQELTGLIFAMTEKFSHTIRAFMQELAVSRISLLEANRSSEADLRPPRKMAGEDHDVSLSDVFSRMAARYPDNIAVRTPTETISYHDLEKWSNKIARELSLCGKTGGRIGIFLDQGLGAIASILAVLKSGNAYVPLDGTMPGQRLQIMIDDADLSMLVTDKKNVPVLKDLVPGLPILQPGHADDGPDDQPGDEPAMIFANSSEDAYIIYTSGSTGTPKGVLQTQRNVLHYVKTYSRLLDITEKDSLTLMSAYMFDAAVLDIFTALLNGATLVMFDLKNENFSSIAQRLQESQVTIYHSTASVFRYFTDSLHATLHFDVIRYVVLGGEQALKADLINFNKYFSAKASLVNLYGLSELTIGSMGFFAQGAEIRSENLTIGTPIDGVTITVINQDGIPTPGTGQLVVSSPSLASQYWHRPDLTSEKFKDGHFLTGERFFLTGDIVEITAEGMLRHFGRSDSQLKIRGYRVEPGEIESRIANYNGVAKCIVHPVTDADGELILTAFILCNPGVSDVRAEDLTKFLKASLPDYMIPRIFLPVTIFPRTSSGKINRQKLEELAAEHLEIK